MYLSKNRLISLWLCSAAVVTIARILHAADLGYDLTLQIQAAQNLLEGNGLSIYSLTGEDDLAKPSQLITLTQFPSGYSFCSAALIAMGFNVGAVIKACGAAATILGWWGWGKLAYAFFREAWEHGRVSRWAGSAIAIGSPLLFTPPWKGTDIFLWAAVPWVLGWIVRASDENASRGLWLDGLAGVVCGFCVLMRYASLFLVIYAGFLILCQSRRVTVLAWRWTAFGAGLFPLVALQFYLNQFVSTVEATPSGVIFNRDVLAGVKYLWQGLRFLTSANFAAVWWMPHKAVTLLTQRAEQAPWVIGATFAVFALPLLFAVKLGYRRLSAASRDVRVAAAGLFVAVPMFLWACGAMFGPFYATVTRYYTPVLPLAVFVAYAFAFIQRKDESKIQGLVRMASLGYLTGYLCIVAAEVVLLPLPGTWASNQREKFLGTFELRRWPSMKLNYEFSAARRYVLALLKEKPDTVLVTNQEQWYYSDPSLDRSRLHSLAGLRASYVSGPARILIMAGEPPFEEPVEALYELGKIRRVGYFEHFPDLHLLKRFPEEHVKILEARIPDGSRIPLNRRAAE